MIPAYLNGKPLSEVVQRFVLEPNEEATVLDYLMGEAELVIKFVHDTESDDQLEHTGTLRVKLRHFAKMSRQMIVVVSHNDMPGILVTEAQLTLYWNEFDYQEGMLFFPIKEINGIEFDPKYKTSTSEWTNVDMLMADFPKMFI